jgi:hypothetical protein
MLISIAKQAIKVLPDVSATAIMRELAAMTQRPALTPLEREAIAGATKMHYGSDSRNAAWVWGDGPLVVLIHGWSGQAAQMAPLAAHVSKQGFRCVAIDVSGHGTSPGRRTAWSDFLGDLSSLAGSLGREVHAYIGHSAGALSMMAARSLRGIRASRYVCVCAPSHPFPPINVIRKRLAPREEVLDRYKAYIAAQFESTWTELERGSAYDGAGADTLFFYDETDKFVHHSEGDKLKGLCPGSELIKTAAYSHVKLLSAPELARAVGAFLTRDVAAGGPQASARDRVQPTA